MTTGKTLSKYKRFAVESSAGTFKATIYDHWIEDYEPVEITAFSDPEPVYIPGIGRLECAYCGTHTTESHFHPGTCANCGAWLYG